MNEQSLYEFAQQIAKEAGELVNQLRKQPLELEEKKDFSDLVTVVDKKVEQFLVDRILEHYPAHGILGEEGAFEGNLDACETIWVIDPIDGTTNFVQDLPFYGISMGVVQRGELIIGVVCNPKTGELFHAKKGNGAFVNGEPLHVQPSLDLTEAVVSTTFIFENHQTQEALHPALLTLFQEVRGIRMVGGAAISLCEIAKGSLSAYVMPQLSPWDYAGGLLIAEEAGAIGSSMAGDPVQFTRNQSLIVAHPGIHEALVTRFPLP